MSIRKTKPVPELTPKQIERFNSYVPKGLPDNACWEWEGGRVHGTYGRFNIAGKTHMAHRVAYSVEHDDRLEGVLTLHTCDNPPCCNPTHLFRGTPQDNTQDMCQKYRQAAPHPRPDMQGTHNHKAKLTDDEVKELRSAWTDYGTKAERIRLSKKFGISLCQAYRIVSGANWSHIN